MRRLVGAVGVAPLGPPRFLSLRPALRPVSACAASPGAELLHPGVWRPVTVLFSWLKVGESEAARLGATPGSGPSAPAGLD